MRALESDAVAEVHDGVINGIRMAGHVKPCRAWGQLFKNGNLHTAQLYSAIVHPHSSHTLPFFLPSFLSHHLTSHYSSLCWPYFCIPSI